MNAIEDWKTWYRSRKIKWYNPAQCRHEMRMIRREAALERIIERQAREIEELKTQVWKLEAQEHNQDDGNEWEKEYYLRGMHR